MEQLLEEIEDARQLNNSKSGNKRKQQSKSKSKPKKRPKTDFFKIRNNKPEIPPTQQKTVEVDENQVWDPPERGNHQQQQLGPMRTELEK
jgi:hypothetical protein